LLCDGRAGGAVAAGMKASPRFRESVANIRLRHQPASIKYPLLQLHIVSNPDAYEAKHLNVRRDVSTTPIPLRSVRVDEKLLLLLLLTVGPTPRTPETLYFSAYPLSFFVFFFFSTFFSFCFRAVHYKLFIVLCPVVFIFPRC